MLVPRQLRAQLSVQLVLAVGDPRQGHLLVTCIIRKTHETLGVRWQCTKGWDCRPSPVIYWTYYPGRKHR